MLLKIVPPSSVEKEFWHLVNAEGDGITVEYGADLLTDDVGSGFPKNIDKQLDDESKVVSDLVSWRYWSKVWYKKFLVVRKLTLELKQFASIKKFRLITH